MNHKWHLKGKGSILDSLLIEWKYFNILGKDVQGFFSYFEANPKNILNMEQTSVNAMVFYKGRKYGEIKVLKHAKKKFSDKTSQAAIGRNLIEIRNKNCYNISGKNKEIKWDLEYKRIEAPVQKKFQLSKLEYVTWCSDMPVAEVNGTVELIKQNKKISINCLGYCDGDWGRWIFPSHMWFWMNYSKMTAKSRFFLIVNELYNDDIRNIIIKKNRKKISFDKNQIKITKVLKKTGKIKMPSEININAEKKEYHLDLHIKPVYSSSILIKTPFFLPDFYLVCQLVKIKGFFKLNNEVIERIDGKGMLEYTTK